ncbi:hypothetical protein QBC43DRAFT_312528 [Cladorrhinum sp. PSN259]|nr:hypothetical protein QBC43DRAFT_312528 [Cladorrhinum sp. PSN259]
MPYTPTPPANTGRNPTAGELASYQTGADRFINLAPLGGFRCFDLANVDMARFNCFAWSVGFTDRWIQGGSQADMVRLYEAYMFRQCQAPAAEVELYQIASAPATITRTYAGRPAVPARNGRPAREAVPPRVENLPNPRAIVMHAHRRDLPALDAPPNLGCTSKLAAGALIAHNRGALADNRPWGQGSPQIVYGAIYQYWQRDPAAHPTLPGNAANEYPVPGHYPDDRIFASGYGTYPPGHPGNTIGLPGGAGNNTRGAPTGNNVARKPASSSSSSSGNSSSGHSRSSSNTSVSSVGSNKAATKPWVFVAASGKSYPSIPLIAPYARIPAPSAAAVKSAQTAAVNISKTNPALFKAFSQAWDKLMLAWYQISASVHGNDASIMTRTREFAALQGLANAKTIKDLIALVVYKLATDLDAFVGIYLYNALERSPDHLIYKKDLFNYNVLSVCGLALEWQVG